jgi:hypothetical protein
MVGIFKVTKNERVSAKESTIVLLAFVMVFGFALSTVPMIGMANEAPAIEIDNPANGATVSGIVDINGWAGDDVEVVAVEVIFDWTIEVNATITGRWENHVNWTYEWNTSEFEDGWHDVTARAWDNGGLHGIHTIEVLVDNEPDPEENHKPLVRITHPDSGATVSGTVNITGNAWDPDENDTVELVQIAIDTLDTWYNATDTSGNGTWWTWVFAWDTTTVEDGHHAIIARAFDGELHGLEDLGVIVKNGNDAPECWIEYPENEATVSGVIDIIIAARDDNNVTLVEVNIDETHWQEATFSHMIEEISIWVFEWDTTTVEDGWHVIFARAYDGDLYSEICKRHVKVDNVQDNRRPWVTIEEPENWAIVSGVINITGHAGDPDENDSVELVQIAIHNDDFWLNCTDVSGNGTWWNWLYELDTTKMENGKYFILARAWDGELHSLAYESHIIVENPVENHRPKVSIVHPESHQELWGIVLVHGEASDPDEGDRVEKVMAKINNGEWFMTVDTSHDDSWSTWAFQWNTMEFENGDHCIRGKSYDGELWSEVAIVCVFVENENHRPEVSITHPENGDTLEGLVLIHGTASDPDVGDRVEMVLVRIDHGDWRHATDTSPDDTFTTWAYEWNTAEADDGVHEICAKSYDGQLYSEVTCIEVITDNVNDPPEVEIIHPEMGSEVSGIVLVHGTAGDDNAVKGVVVRIDHDEWDEAKDVSKDGSWRTWAYEWVTQEYENGEHRVCAKSWDGELWSELDCIEVYVNNTKGGQDLDRDPESIFGDLELTMPLIFLGMMSAVVAALILIRRHFRLRKQ